MSASLWKIARKELLGDGSKLTILELVSSFYVNVLRLVRLIDNYAVFAYAKYSSS